MAPRYPSTDSSLQDNTTDFVVTAAPLEGRTRRVYDLMEYAGAGEYEEVDGLICKVNCDRKHRNKQRAPHAFRVGESLR